MALFHIFFSHTAFIHAAAPEAFDVKGAVPVPGSPQSFCDFFPEPEHDWKFRGEDFYPGQVSMGPEPDLGEPEGVEEFLSRLDGEQRAVGVGLIGAACRRSGFRLGCRSDFSPTRRLRSTRDVGLKSDLQGR